MKAPWRLLTGWNAPSGPSEDSRGSDERRGRWQDTPEPVGPFFPSPPLAQPDASPERGAGPVPGSMERLGQQNELLHVRFSYMADRLEDLKSLSDDFGELTKPIEAMAVELPRAKARVLEVEALLSRERQEAHSLREETRALGDRLSAALDDLDDLGTRSRTLQENLDQSEASLAADRIRLAEQRKLLTSAERQLEVETDNRQRLQAELGTATTDIGQMRDELSRLEETVTRQVNQILVLEQEKQHVGKVVERQAQQIVDLQAALNEAEKNEQVRSREIYDLRSRLDIERGERHKVTSQHENTLSALHSEKSSLTLKNESLVARLQAVEQTVEQMRTHVAEKDGTLRASEDALRATTKENANLTREIDVLKYALGDHGEQLRESERVYHETSQRADMLAKALAAKDAALQNALDKAHARSERIEELTKRYEQERQSLEAANRRLLEELENEKAERTLAQGALKIARESRSSLQRQNESLKRVNRSMRNAVFDEDEAGEAENEDTSSNVSVFQRNAETNSGPDER